MRVCVPFATIQLPNVDDGTARRWFLILFGVISDVTVNKDVGYQMYDDVDDSYNLWYHQFRLEMY